jgi:hypothetical protein
MINSHSSSILDISSSSFSSYSSSPTNSPHCIHDHDSNNGHNHETNYNIPFSEHEGSGWESASDEHLLIITPLTIESSTSVVLEHHPESDNHHHNKTHTPLYLGWNYYYHLPNDKNWNVDSYKIIMSNIRTLEELIGMNELMTDNIIKNCMLFVMRVGVTPMWEDVQNRQGGCFSYKVTNKSVTQVWRKLMYLLCGYTLTIDPTHMDLVNGITISPKRGFCIVKIWMRDCSLQDPAVITNIDQLLRNGCLFKAHSPEF